MSKSLKWLIPIVVVIGIIFYLFTSSGMGKIATDLTQAYADPELYNNAIEKANSDQRILENIGEIQPIDKMSILNGEVNFSDDNQKVNSTIKVIGSKGNGKLDLTAERENESWRYERINVRIKDSAKKKKTIEIINLP
ncbi:hypothetical protein G3I01_11685 [Gramella sp. MT6]|uniref:cytochrome c oxidase assembly factor Coa1 family protein n=1 Tax=Gramella sp. MT6 TaxID=2705471 RepID=UPI001C5F3C26|nr:cytochrome c oxidase assembly factor Coa1 family protein [Gramella sp. MT6]QYA26146.1 hypothetical protein G3I01_11685 [Gramella sp. MT6]